MFGQDFDVKVWSKDFEFWNLIKICVRTCFFGKQNSTLGSVVPLAMFVYIIHQAKHVHYSVFVFWFALSGLVVSISGLSWDMHDPFQVLLFFCLKSGLPALKPNQRQSKFQSDCIKMIFHNCVFGLTAFLVNFNPIQYQLNFNF